MKVEDVEGIGPVSAEKLALIGIDQSKDLPMVVEH